MASGRGGLFRLTANRISQRLQPRVAGLVLTAVAATVLAGTCGAVSATLSSVSGVSVAMAASRAKIRADHPNPTLAVQHVTVTADSLNRMMDEDVSVSQPYVNWVRSSQGDAAAAQMEDRIRSPYRKRIEQMQSAGQDHQDFDIQVVTVWGSLSFSTRSYDPNFNAMDPVSLLFTGNGSPERVFREMVTGPECGTDAQCAPPSYQDDKGVGAQYKGFNCQSGTQWVLMGNAGEDLQWRPSSRAVMRSFDKCTQGVRDHMRIFGGAQSMVFGDWSVGTPHREVWGDGTGRLGHFIQSWTGARMDIASYWESLSKMSGVALPVTPAVSLGTAGIYQKVDFDGQAIAIDICPCP